MLRKLSASRHPPNRLPLPGRRPVAVAVIVTTGCESTAGGHGGFSWLARQQISHASKYLPVDPSVDLRHNETDAKPTDGSARQLAKISCFAAMV
jgi:hypothetical protein